MPLNHISSANRFILAARLFENLKAGHPVQINAKPKSWAASQCTGAVSERADVEFWCFVLLLGT